MDLSKLVTLLEENELPGPGPFNALARLLKFADTDSSFLTIGTNRNGGLRLSVSPSAVSPGGDGGYHGPFAVSYTQDGRVKVSPGFVMVNGTFGKTEEAIVDIPASSSYLCVHFALELESGSFKISEESFRIQWGDPSATDYPIAMYDPGSLVSLRVPLVSFVFAYPGGVL